MSASGTGSRARLAVWIFVGFSALYIATTRGHFIGTDELTMYQTTRSIWENGNFSTSSQLPATVTGREGGKTGIFNAGQPIAALPLYGLGKAVHAGLSRLGREDWVRTLAGWVIQDEGPEYRWGGDLEIFFVNLFNAFVTAFLVAVFFLFSTELGATARSALGAALLLGTTTYAATFSNGFLQHPSEALLVMLTFFFLRRDALAASAGLRFLAGCALALLLLIRPQSGIAIPALAFYFFSTVLRRRPTAGRARALAREVWPIAAPLAVGLAAHLAINYLRLGRWSLVGAYGGEIFVPFSLTAVYGFLFSPGESIFVFTPLLCLLPWLFPQFWRRQRAEAAAVGILAASYVVFYAFYGGWHGLWSAMGPRYLMVLVPVLLLPLAEWIDSRGGRAWRAIAPLALAGFVVTFVNMAVNFAFTYNRAGYPDYRPKFSFLFIPDVSPLAVEWQALFGGDLRVDTWLLDVKRDFGAGRLLGLALPLVALIALSIRRGARALREPARPGEGRRLLHLAAFLAAIAVAGTGAGLLGASRYWNPRSRLSVDELMRAGLDRLYTRHDAPGSAAFFQRVLEIEPNHYGANYQLASAFEWAGRRDAARSQWEKVLRMAEGYSDSGTAADARRHLEALR